MGALFQRVPDDAPAILQDTDPLLREKSAPVTEFNGDLTALVQRMAYAMLSRNGMGLSAVQIGVPVRVIIARDDPRLVVMVNPVITRRLRRDDVQQEGCLSVPPSKWKRIARPAKCEVEWQDLYGTNQSGGFSGMLARCIQHECDHLEGILITDLPRAA